MYNLHLFSHIEIPKELTIDTVLCCNKDGAGYGKSGLWVEGKNDIMNKFIKYLYSIGYKQYVKYLDKNNTNNRFEYGLFLDDSCSITIFENN